MINNFLSVYGIYYPSVTIKTRVKWRIHVYVHCNTTDTGSINVYTCCDGNCNAIRKQVKQLLASPPANSSLS